jgi:hypothetical protein
VKELKKFAALSNMVRVFILDSSLTTGAGLTGLLYNTASLVIDVIADNAASGATYHYKSAATATIQDIGTSGSTAGTYSAPSASNCRFAPVDATNFPGLYELQFLDGLFDDSGATKLIIKVSGPTNCTPTFAEIQLVSFDPYDTVRLGLTALPAVAAEGSGGLYTRGTGAGQINQDANGRIDVNAKAWIGTAIADALYTFFGITAKGTMASPGGHSTTQGSFASGDGAKSKVGFYIWVPATYDVHRIKTISTDAWTVDAADAFGTDPFGATYYISAVPISIPFVAADFSNAAITALATGVISDATPFLGASVATLISRVTAAVALNSDMATLLTRVSANVALNSDMATLLSRVTAAVALNSDVATLLSNDTTLLTRISAAVALNSDEQTLLTNVATLLTRISANAALNSDMATLLARITAAVSLDSDLQALITTVGVAGAGLTDASSGSGSGSGSGAGGVE